MVQQDTVALLASLAKAQLEFMETAQITVIPRIKTPVQQADNTQEKIDKLLAKKLDNEAKLKCLKEDIIGHCQRCKLGQTRTNLVFGVGSSQAKLVFVGEAPGAEEDKQGLPFVGRAGQLLTKMIEAMGLKRDDVYICNVVKSRPPENRDPEPDEVEACEPFLKAQLAIIKPQVIVALGRYAVQCLMRSSTPISQLRGKWSTYEGIKLMPTFHPAYLLRNPPKKKEAWEDLQAVMKEMGIG